jgi:hypothetical protein
MVILLVLLVGMGGVVLYLKATSDYVHTNVKSDFKDLYFHNIGEYSVSTVNNNVLDFKKFRSSYDLKIVIVEDVETGGTNWYEEDYEYSRWNDFNDNYDNKVTLHITKQYKITGGKFKSGKNTYRETELVTQ